VQIAQEVGSVACHEVHAAQFTLLQNFVGIQRVTQQFGMTTQDLALA
jgi:hypothetical protein